MSLFLYSCWEISKVCHPLLSAVHQACAYFITVLFVSLPNSEVEQVHIGDAYCLSLKNESNLKQEKWSWTQPTKTVALFNGYAAMADMLQIGLYSRQSFMMTVMPILKFL
jgi:hypothetical protein